MRGDILMVRSVNSGDVFVIFYIPIYSKVRWLLVVWRSWVLTWLPMFMGKSFLTGKGTSASTTVRRYHISCCWSQAIQLSVCCWTWRFFGKWKSWGCCCNPEFRSLEFTNFCAGLCRIKLNSLIGSWSRGFLVWKMSVDCIDCLWADWIWRFIRMSLFVLILNDWKITWPTPGCLWICGIR